MDPKPNVSMSPYSMFAANPIWYSDPLLDVPTEYDKAGNKISDLGGDKVDFYHQEDGNTKIVDRESGATNTINGGERLISGYALRDANTSWGEITNEFIMQQGPSNSLFADFENSNEGVFRSLHSPLSSYSSLAREKSLTSRDNKGLIKMDYGNANPFVAKDMWEQMFGRTNVSWYKLGDKTLFMMHDTKSFTSLSYRVGGNWERTQNTMMGNTRQTYIWVENNRDVEIKVKENIRYWQQQFQKVLSETRRPVSGKI